MITPARRPISRISSRLLAMAMMTTLAMFAVLVPAMAPASASQGMSVTEVATIIGADELWAAGHTGLGVDVAVIDTGVNPVVGLDAPGKLVHGPDLSFEAGLEEWHSVDTFGHGTVMASIIAGNDAPGGFQGIAPDARILSMKVADNTGQVDVSQVIAALDWIVEYGRTDDLNVRVINLSYGTNGQQSYLIDPLAEAVERAWEAGYVVVVAAGNDGADANGLANPALDPFAIAVAAAEGNGVADFTNVGTDRVPDIMAPGSQILGLAALDSRLAQTFPNAVIDGRYLRGSGTSQAAAVVSGAAALLLDQRPELTPDQTKALLVAGAIVESQAPDLPDNRADRAADMAGIPGYLDAARDGSVNAGRTRALERSVERLLANWDGSGPGGTGYDRDSGSGMVDLGSSRLLPTLDITQDFPRSDGSGSLDAARGDHHVVMPDGSLLQGEVTFVGTPWAMSNWGSWTSGSWSSASWSSGSWSSASWSSASWSSASWSSGSWSSASWSSGSWSSGSWSSGSWSSGSWSSGSWSSGSWSSGSWSSGSWSSASWS